MPAAGAAGHHDPHQPAGDAVSLRDRNRRGGASDALRKQLFDGTVGEFIEAKLAERGTRHRKQGGQRYMLEPNVKEGKGGLRDLQTLYWIAKYEHGVSRDRATWSISACSAPRNSPPSTRPSGFSGRCAATCT
jgi:hypothetical protein